MSRGKRGRGRARWWWLALGIVLVIGVVGYFTLKDRTKEMRSSGAYYRWTRGKHELTIKIYEAFNRDGEFKERFVGLPIESLKELFPELTNGAVYPENSYRRVGEDELTRWSERLGRAVDSRYWLNGEALESYWDDIPEAERWGFCVLVGDGKIIAFTVLKG